MQVKDMRKGLGDDALWIYLYVFPSEVHRWHLLDKTMKPEFQTRPWFCCSRAIKAPSQAWLQGRKKRRRRQLGITCLTPTDRESGPAILKDT